MHTPHVSQPLLVLQQLPAPCPRCQPHNPPAQPASRRLRGGSGRQGAGRSRVAHNKTGERRQLTQQQPRRFLVRQVPAVRQHDKTRMRHRLRPQTLDLRAQ